MRIWPMMIKGWCEDGMRQVHDYEMLRVCLRGASIYYDFLRFFFFFFEDDEEGVRMMRRGRG